MCYNGGCGAGGHDGGWHSAIAELGPQRGWEVGWMVGIGMVLCQGEELGWGTGDCVSVRVMAMVMVVMAMVMVMTVWRWYR